MSSLDEIVKKLDKQLYDSNRAMLDRGIQNYYHRGAENWYFYCLFYVEATRTLVDQLPQTVDETSSFNNKKAIIIPTIYTFKHTLELILKYIYITIKKQKITSHDLGEISSVLIYKDIVSKIKTKEVSKVIPYDEEIIKKSIKSSIEDLKYLSENYLFQLSMLDSMKEGYFFIIDENNELFKYPNTNSVRFQIDPLSLYNLPVRDIRRLKEDFKKLQNAFYYLEHCFHISGLGSSQQTSAK